MATGLRSRACARNVCLATIPLTDVDEILETSNSPSAKRKGKNKLDEMKLLFNLHLGRHHRIAISLLDTRPQRHQFNKYTCFVIELLSLSTIDPPHPQSVYQ